MAVRAIDANELYRIEKLLDTDIVRQDKVALNLLEQVLYDIQHVPTLAPPNEPLTCRGCMYAPDCPSEIHCQGCARMYTDHYRRPPEGEANGE